MGRPRGFDRQEVIDKAVQVFWLKGYEATTVQDIVDATGVNRGSLYNAFADKADLFLAAMERYGEQSPARALVDAAATAPPRRTIEALFAEVVDIGAGDGLRRGCLLTNTAVELSARDGVIAGRVAASMRTIEDALFRLIERGQALGEVDRRHEARALARFLVAVLHGLRVMAKVDPDRRRLQDVADLALAQLD